MNPFLDNKTREKIGFYYAMDMLSISSVFGKDMFFKLKPITSKKALVDEYNSVEKCIKIIDYFTFFENILIKFKNIKGSLKRIKDDEVLDEVELFEIKNFAILVSKLSKLLKQLSLKLNNILLYDFNAIYDLLTPCAEKTSSFFIYDEYSPELHKLRAKKKDIEKNIYREIRGDIKNNLLETRALIVNKEKEEEFKVRKKLTSKISKYVDKIFDSILSIGKLDIYLAKAKLAVQYNLCKPSLSNKISFVNGINPMVKEKVEAKGGTFTPITMEISTGATVITGANMGGKTVTLTIIALNYLLAYMGFYVFADSFEFIPLDFISFLSEDAESLENGLSTFGGEIMKLKKILDALQQKKGIIIFDEFARGTNPKEGSNITKALIKYLNNFNSLTVISTHYDGICPYAKANYQVRGLKNIDLNSIGKIEKEEAFNILINKYMDYSIEKVDKNTSVPKDALNICSLLGIDSEIIDNVKKFYEEDYNEGQT